jgi:diguanylate cyclase (GGDEF)-like protein
MARAAGTRPPHGLFLHYGAYFKQYNDSYGHPAGDEVLKTVAQILQTGVREGDFPARYGGEEFAVVLQDTDAETALQVAERIRAAVESHAFPHRKVTLSIGVAQFAMGEEADAMIQRADVGLYEAKSAGRNRTIYLPTVTILEDKTVAEDIELEGSDQKTLQEEPPLVLQNVSLDSAETEEFAFPVSSGDPGASYGVQLLGGLEGLLQESPTPVLTALLDIMDRRGVESRGHSVRVTRYALRLGNEVAALYETLRPTRPLLPRMTPGDMANIAFGALLHDIGKMGIPDGVLRKRGKLTDDEWRQIRRHPLAGAELIADDPLLSRALPIIRFHHERWDGTGYPQGLRSEAIPLVARIFAVCDAFDTLTVARAYRSHMNFQAAREEVARGAGTQFDPDVVQAFMEIPEAEWRNLASPWITASPVLEPLRRAA